MIQEGEKLTTRGSRARDKNNHRQRPRFLLIFSTKTDESRRLRVVGLPVLTATHNNNNNTITHWDYLEIVVGDFASMVNITLACYSSGARQLYCRYRCSIYGRV
jgi:hypothetical protein